MRRFGTRALGKSVGGNHLDADELNAFAEGALPPAARARYVSHLAECDQCRRQASELAIAAGAMTRTEQTVVDRRERAGWWASLTGLFAVPVLRYAAFAAVLLIVGGVGFLALRQRSQHSAALLAGNEGSQAPVNETKQVADSNGAVAPVPNTSPNTSRAETPTSLPAPAATQSPASQPPSGLIAGLQEPLPATTMTKPAEPKPLEAMKESAKAPEITSKAGEESRVAKALPYSPAPPGEKQGFGQVQTQSAGAAAAPGGPRQQQQNQYVLQSADKAERERDAIKDARLDDANRKSDQPVLAGRANDEKLRGGPSRNMDNNASNNRASNENMRKEPAKTEASDSEDGSQTRSAGGHKFRRQGSAWVDQKFKSSMSLKNVARGADEFSALDSGLRSIANQISGEVIVVWKGKAYLIK